MLILCWRLPLWISLVLLSHCRSVDGSMPMTLSLSSWITFTGCVNFLSLTHESISNKSSEFIVSPDVATQLWALELFWPFITEGHAQRMLVHACQSCTIIKKPKECFFFLFSRGLILSPWKGIIISKSVLQFAIETEHRLRIYWGMMHGAWMRGAIKLFRETPVLLFVHFLGHCFHPLSTLLASMLCLGHHSMVFFLFFASILLACDFVVCSSYSTFCFCLHCYLVPFCFSN